MHGHVFPTPRELSAGSSDATDSTSSFSERIITRLDPSLPDQGYELVVDSNSATLSFADELGRRYGESTVAQLRAYDGSLPAIRIRDWPDFPVRGYMLDISRDRVPTRRTLERLVRVLSLGRYNHLQLYIEHTFAYRDHQTVWVDASPLTHEDLRWLDELCSKHGIELVANQNCFGHMGRWLSHDRYRNMADSPGGAEIIPGMTVPPTVLAPTSENAEFVVGLVREQMAMLRSKRVNIGCDETFELGGGLSAARAADIGVVGVYAEHLSRIVEPLLDDGASVLFWGDVLARDPHLFTRLPDGDLTALVWNYDAPEAATPAMSPELDAILSKMGIDLHSPTDFQTRLKPFKESGTPFWVCPGTSTWQSFIGRWDNARSNLLDAARAGRDQDAVGYLVTDWGDNGHHQPPSISDLPILYGGAVSWCATANEGVDPAAWADALVYGDSRSTALQEPSGGYSAGHASEPAGGRSADRSIGRIIESVGTLGSSTGQFARNLSPIFAAMFPHQLHLIGGEPNTDKISAVIKALDTARGDLAAAQPTCEDAAIVVDELDVAIGLARHGALRLARSSGLDTPDDNAMRADLSRLIARYRNAWLGRSRPGGLADSVAHLETTLTEYR